MPEDLTVGRTEGAPALNASDSRMEHGIEALLAGEGIMVLRRLGPKRFRVEGTPPVWASQVGEVPLRTGTEFDPAAVFLFLPYFLEDAGSPWATDDAPPQTSDIWCQTLRNGEDLHFTATARRMGGSEILLVRALGVDFEERRHVLQKARELALAHERLLKEISKKEALLHCLVHDVAGPATTVIQCFGLLGLEDGLTASARELVNMGSSEARRQQVLLRGTLDIFAADLSALEEFFTDPATAPDVLRSVNSVLKQLTASFAAKGITWSLVPEPDRPSPWLVAGHGGKLERILYNLLENAVRHSPVGSTVTIRLTDEVATVCVAIDDQGPGLDPGLAATLFERFVQGKTNGGSAGLGLYFCRMMINRWGGQIGCHSLPAIGSRFWFRLPKPGAGPDPTAAPTPPKH